ncbi:ArsR family transcriptional regulator [Halobacillus fulvus]|nr:ArsR family transcriptional regulator [Halobacillus fulvus]
MNSKAQLIMHPVRMKIIQCLSRGPATVYELLEWIGDVPQATLYRHLNELKKNEIIMVTEEKKIRGAIEKTYTLKQNGARITADEAEDIDMEEHLQMFMTFFATLVQDMESYFEGKVDFQKDTFGYSQFDLHLTEEEWDSFKKDMTEMMKPYLKNKPTDHTRKVSMTQIFIPDRKE